MVPAQKLSRTALVNDLLLRVVLYRRCAAEMRDAGLSHKVVRKPLVQKAIAHFCFLSVHEVRLVPTADLVVCVSAKREGASLHDIDGRCLIGDAIDTPVSAENERAKR